MSEKILLIDGHSILNRAFYGLPELTNAEGLHTNAHRDIFTGTHYKWSNRRLTGETMENFEQYTDEELIEQMHAGIILF